MSVDKKKVIYQYVCPRCGSTRHVDITSAAVNNAKCRACQWIGDSSTAADEADEKNREASRTGK